MGYLRYLPSDRQHRTSNKYYLLIYTTKCPVTCGAGRPAGHGDPDASEEGEKKKRDREDPDLAWEGGRILSLLATSSGPCEGGRGAQEGGSPGGGGLHFISPVFVPGFAPRQAFFSHPARGRAGRGEDGRWGAEGVVWRGGRIMGGWMDGGTDG